jgi:hypothetical protein
MWVREPWKCAYAHDLGAPNPEEEQSDDAA